MCSEILQAALKQVHRWGWSEETIAAGAKELGYSPMIHGIFPRLVCGKKANIQGVGKFCAFDVIIIFRIT
jgi:hypothetical protein